MPNYEIKNIDGGYQFQVDGVAPRGSVICTTYSSAATFAFGWLKAEIQGLLTKLEERKH